MSTTLRTLLAVVACLWAFTQLAVAEPLQLRVAWASTPAQLGPIIFLNKDKLIEKGVLKNEGKSYSAEFIRIPGSALQVTAVATGEVHLAALSYSAFALAIVNGGQPLKAIIDVFQDGPGYSTTYGVLEDSPIQSVDDVEGKVFGVTAFGGAIDIGARAMLLKSGLRPEADVSMLELQFGTQEAMLRSGKVDITGFTADSWFRALQNGGIRPVFTMRDSMGDSQMIFLAGRDNFVDSNRAALIDFAEDYIRGTRWLLDPANREEALQLIVDVTDRPHEVFSDWVLVNEMDYYRDPDGRLNVQALQRNVDQLQTLGLINRKLDVTPHVDASIADEAADRLQ